MSTPLEHYALLSDQRTAALVSRDGSIDWLCFPRFDSSAVFTAILGTPGDGRWRLFPPGGELDSREYVEDTFVLESHWTTPTGTLTVTDFLPIDEDPAAPTADLVRSVTCTSGHVEVEHDLRLRFDYGAATPWLQTVEVDGASEIHAIAGPDSLALRGPSLAQVNGSCRGTFAMSEGETLTWVLSWSPSYLPDAQPRPETLTPVATIAYWRAWARRIDASGPYAAEVRRSLLVLRALTERLTGGIVAAPTTSLPEEFGGERNWDYRFVWLRDSALTIEALLSHGFVTGARAWRTWLLRAMAGDPHDLRIMYGLDGSRHLPELELTHLEGYEGSRPVRIGNGAAHQFQADVVGEVMVALELAREAGLEETEFSWGLQRALLDYAWERKDDKDHGIWEMRGEPAFFTHGRAMMWAAFDRGVRAVERYGLDGDVETWRERRDLMREEILAHGWNAEIGSFTQTYGSREVDASLLQLAHIGFVAYDDPMMLSTVARIEADLLDEHGFLHRYRTASGLDGLEGDEYPFLICSFWLVEQYARSGRVGDARRTMDALVAVSSDLGLLAEEYDTSAGRLAGNYPQAFSHLGLVRAADALTPRAPATPRESDDADDY
ncbi:glycoside hydrolase family 15 protein [Georgenia sp. Z1344]|uniref:glycoside hydrolase family 15 protein n=1 Tax=Georgenia sp. Z1344 TaxID=3416706 RepID=UPI003CF1BE8D